MCRLNEDNTITPCGTLSCAYDNQWIASMHPHVNCPKCDESRTATFADVVSWFVAHGGSRSWQGVIEKFFREYNVTKKESV